MENRIKWYPSIGDSFTVNVNKRTGDHSWSDTIWTCKCVNRIHVVFEHHVLGFVLLLKDDYDFAPMECPAKPVKREEPKWEPKGGEWTLFSTGKYKLASSNNEWRLFGVECATQDQIEILRDMTRRNNLIFQAKCEIEDKGGCYEISYFAPRNIWVARYDLDRVTNPELSFTTRENAEQVIKMLRLNEEN